MEVSMSKVDEQKIRIVDALSGNLDYLNSVMQVLVSYDGDVDEIAPLASKGLDCIDDMRKLLKLDA
jgi:hypothetical protein